METDSQEVVEPESIAQGLRRSGRIRHEPERYRFLITDDQRIELVDQNEPTTYREAIECPNYKDFYAFFFPWQQQNIILNIEIKPRIIARNKTELKQWYKAE